MITRFSNQNGHDGNGSSRMSLTTDNAKALRSIGGIWGGGTFGFLVCTYFYAIGLMKGLLDDSSPRSIFAWETADAMRATTVTLGPGHEPVKLPSEMFRD